MSGFSIEEAVAPGLWFEDGADGPWEWKGPIAQGKRCVYGKLYRGRAGFVSLEWFPRLQNARRSGLSFDERYELGLAPRRDAELYRLVQNNGSLTTKAIKWMGDYGRGGKKGFDTIVTRLQMQTYLVIEDFEYAIDKHGAPYGWGIARYTTPENWLGKALKPVKESPEESFAKIVAHLQRKLPDASEAAIMRLMKG